MGVLMLLSGGLGVLVALGYAGAVWSVHALSNLAFFQQWSAAVPPFARQAPALWTFVFTLAAGILVRLVLIWGKEPADPPGVTALKALPPDSSHAGGRAPRRLTLAQTLATWIGIAGGYPFGMEASVVSIGRIGVSFGGQWMPLAASERRLLGCAAVAAGVAAVFSAPAA